MRRMSWSSKKSTHRTNRRAIANSTDQHSNNSDNGRQTNTNDSQNNSHPIVVGEEECGAITYTANLLGNRPRIMDVCIPSVSEDGTVSTEWKAPDASTADNSSSGGGGASAASNGSADNNNTMLNRFKTVQQQLDTPEDDDALLAGEVGPAPPRETNNITPPVNRHGLMILQNRPPWWNMELGAFVLNFGGRVSVASVKNFQLCERDDRDYVMLQFGRIQGRHAFTMDFQHPLTPLQAFGIAISSLQSKISFG